MDMNSSITSSTAAASAPHNHQQEVMVSPPIIEETRSPKQAHATQQASGSGEHRPRPQQPEALRCPRCNSNNTKFCYYNNYSTTQLRYFCKACCRYWTHGGTLRNVPIGGGCRKNKHASVSVSGSDTSSSSSATYAPLSPGTNTSSNKMGIKTHLMMVPNMMMPTPMTTGLFPNVLPTLMSTVGGESNLNMDNQHASMPFTPMSLSNPASGPVLVAGESGTMPCFLEMLGQGLFLDSSSYDAGLSMSGGSNVVDMPFALPSYGAMHGHGLSGSTTDDARQLVLVATQQGVNTDGGFVGSVGVEEDKEVEGDNKAMVKSNMSNNGRSLLDCYWTKPDNNNNNNSSSKGQQG